MNEWTAAAPIVIETTQPDPPASPARRRITLARVRNWPRWQQATVVTLVYTGIAVLLVRAVAQALGARYMPEIGLLLAGCASVYILITSIAALHGRLS